MTPQEMLSLKDIPETLIRTCTERLWHYTVGFVGLERSERTEDANLLGSGVLVRAGDVRAILTADHVLDVLPTSGRLGLVLSHKLTNTTIDVSGIAYSPIARGPDPESGPDLGTVLLSHSIASDLGALKSYYNLDSQKDRMMSSPPDDQEGIWATQGFVEEMTVIDSAHSPFEYVKGFCQFGTYGGVKDYESHGEHDYYTFPIIRDISNQLPFKFGGTSGGGLWHILIKRENGKLAIDQILLQGLVFYQYPTDQQESSALRCHGPQSVYGIAYPAVVKSTS